MDIWSQVINKTTNIWSALHSCARCHEWTHCYTNKQLQNKGTEGESDEEREGEEKGWYDIYDQWNNLVQRASKTKGTIRNTAGMGPSAALMCVWFMESSLQEGKREKIERSCVLSVSHMFSWEVTKTLNCATLKNKAYTNICLKINSIVTIILHTFTFSQFTQQSRKKLKQHVQRTSQLPFFFLCIENP